MLHFFLVAAALFSCCTLLILQNFHVALSSLCNFSPFTFFAFQFFQVALFLCCFIFMLHFLSFTFFVLHFSPVVPLACCTFLPADFCSCCTISILRIFRVALFSSSIFFVLHSFHVALF